jgi:cyclic-di-GMP phosphodiesterase TipF (flagellum assembly factor)
LNDLEAALEMIDKDLQRIDRVEENVSRLDQLADRVERLDQSIGDTGSGERAGGSARFDQFAQEFDEVHAKIENLRADLEGESRNQREKMTGDLRALEGLIKQLSHELIAAAEMPAAAVPDRAAPPPALAEIEKIEPDDDEAEDAFEVEAVEPEEEETVAVLEIVEEEIVIPDEPPAVEADIPARPSPRVETPRVAQSGVEEEPLIAADTAGIGDHEMLEIVSQAIEAGRVDLYLQPTVTLPERRPR